METVPSEPAFRFELSNAYAAVGDYHRARLALESIPEHDVDPEVLTAAKLRAAAMRDPGRAAPWDQRVRDLQQDALQARVASGRASDDDALRLARLAVEHRVEDPSGATLAEAAKAIEAALEQSAGNVALLEHLVLIRQLLGDPRLDEALRRLERVDPGSAVVAAFVPQPTDWQAQQQTQARLAGLFRAAVEGDSATRAAALADLGAEVARLPGDPERRTTYALALVATGRRDEAVEQASAAARLAGENHAMHYNVGQVFLRAGETRRAREHLQLARRYARDDAERADADKLLAELDG